MPEMPKTDRPNILFIMADQFRHDHVSCTGASWMRTPNIDRIASSGVRFTQCTTNSPVCAPARIGLAAGMQPSRLGSVGNDSFLPLSAPIYYRRLRDSGYRVGCVGKLDLAKPDPYNGRHGDRPVTYAWGFTHPEECEGKMHAGVSPTPNGPYNFWLQERGLFEKFHADYTARRANWIANCHDSVLPTDAFEDCYIGRRAAEWIARAPDDFPWHYFVSFVGPHDPFDPPAEYAERYRDAEMPPPVSVSDKGKPGWVTGRAKEFDPEFVAVTRRQYSAAIECIDDQIGLIMRALEERGQLENTYVIFAADHGEMLGDHGLYTKSVPYEAALRVPLVVAGPGIEGGRVSDAVVELIDVNPTICDFAGVGAAENIDARSLAPIMAGDTETHREDAVSAIRRFRLIRTASQKYVESYNDEHELYDLAADPDEQRNIIADEPELARELRGRLAARYMEGECRR